MIPDNLPEFNAIVHQFAARHASGVSMDVIVRKLMLDGLTGLVNYTPVDTGYLRFNWQVSITFPRVFALGEKGQHYSEFKAGHVNRGQLAGKIPAKGTLPPFPVAYLVNNAEYAEIINNGSANRHANMMVERTEQDLVAAMLAEMEPEGRF